MRRDQDGRAFREVGSDCGRRDIKILMVVSIACTKKLLQTCHIFPSPRIDVAPCLRIARLSEGPL